MSRTHRFRPHHSPVLLALAAADGDLPAFEIDVLDTPRRKPRNLSVIALVSTFAGLM
jgi:hypothetical protein